jgi:hypothetical protein
MRRNANFAIVAAFFVVLMETRAEARDSARDLRRMVGFTILDAASVQSVSGESIGEKVVVLSNGMVFQVQTLILAPLVLTDVIVFAKQVKGTNVVLTKLLIENEAYDAIRLK